MTGAGGIDAAASRASNPWPDRPEPRQVRPLGPFRSNDPIAADAQSTADPLRPTAADGWSPDEIVAVSSRHDGGFAGSALNFALGGVDERPGQRLSVAQVDELAPFFATQFGLDEGYVRRELAKVYLYVGGPSVDDQAMTIGHHLFVPDEKSLQRMLTLPGKRWLTHELAHTMQFLAYQGASPQHFLADYFTSMVIGKDPRQPGSGTGAPVWGAFFTGLRTAGYSEGEIGKGATSIRDTFVSTVLPAAIISVPVAITAGGALTAVRATTGTRMLGTGSAMSTAFGGIAAPALAGSVIGTFREQLGDTGTKVLGAAAGGIIAGLALWRGGAFAVGGSTAATEVGRALGRGSAIGLAAGATAVGAGIGFMSASASANTVRGWSTSAETLHSHRRAPKPGETPERMGLQEAVHDSHWLEIDAEAVARTFSSGDWDRPEGDEPVQGRTPADPTSLAGRIDKDISARLDWGLKVPLIVGIPAAVGVGAGVLAARGGSTMVRRTLEEGRPFGEALSEAMLMLGDEHRGVANSLGVGAALTIAPLIAGGLTAPIVYNATNSESAARLGGAGAGAITTGALLTLLLKGKGNSLIAMSGKVGAGMAVAGALGFLAGGIATDALTPDLREYDVSRWSRP